MQNRIPIKFWRNIADVLVLISIILTVLALVFLGNDIVIHWTADGIPNGNMNKWMFFVFPIFTVMSSLSYNSWMKGLKEEEIGGAFTVFLTYLFVVVETHIFLLNIKLIEPSFSLLLILFVFSALFFAVLVGVRLRRNK